MKQGYFIEWNGDCWQSVFPSWEAEKSALHQTWKDALAYMVHECGVSTKKIKPLPRPEYGLSP